MLGSSGRSSRLVSCRVFPGFDAWSRSSPHPCPASQSADVTILCRCLLCIQATANLSMEERGYREAPRCDPSRWPATNTHLELGLQGKRYLQYRARGYPLSRHLHSKSTYLLRRKLHVTSATRPPWTEVSIIHSFLPALASNMPRPMRSPSRTLATWLWAWLRTGGGTTESSVYQYYPERRHAATSFRVAYGSPGSVTRRIHPTAR